MCIILTDLCILTSKNKQVSTYPNVDDDLPLVPLAGPNYGARCFTVMP